ncbi:c-type cytochrome [Methylotetracoccus oryzae]|uniref:c-type cytochrome n=1 Tax=Methylotetracoccus oryzae TaxID=1919059 RepID=UPI00111B14D5|nr:cytochrome c [Methylotetracoccus oryzae]
MTGARMMRLGPVLTRQRGLGRRWVLSACVAVAAALPACTLFERPPAADSPEAAARTAYLLCDGCHGPRDIRMDTMSPKIIGQKQGYLAAKLRDYRSGERSHPWMDGVARELTDQDVAQLAAHYAARPRSRAK